MDSLVDRVAVLVRDIAAEEVMPRFRSLRADEIVGKATIGDPDDIVTVVDRRVESRLAAALVELVPGSLVVGEEAVAERPEVLEALAGEAPVWVIDPIDGTKNFARGDERFGVMIALVEAGHTRAAWIALPALHQMYVAEAGSGAFLDGARLHTHGPASPPRGTVHDRLMPRELAAAVARSTAERYMAITSSGAAAVEYTALARGDKDFAVYYRLDPWDHAAGALVLAEAGGRVEHRDGSAYTPRSRTQVTVLAANAELSAEVRRWLA